MITEAGEANSPAKVHPLVSYTAGQVDSRAGDYALQGLAHSKSSIKLTLCLFCTSAWILFVPEKYESGSLSGNPKRERMGMHEVHCRRGFSVRQRLAIES